MLVSNWPDVGIVSESARQNNGQNSDVGIQNNCEYVFLVSLNNPINKIM